MEKRIIAAILAILLGSFGAHKFYMNKYLLGVLYLVLSFTGLPAVVSFIEGIIYLIQSEEQFEQRLK